MNLAAVAQLSQALFDWVWRTSLQAAVLIALVFLVQLIFGRVLSARWRYGLWLLVLLRLSMPMVPASAWSVFNLGRSVLAVSTPLKFQAEATYLPGRSPEPTIGAPGAPSETHPPATRTSHRISAAPVVWLMGFLGSWLVVLRQYRKFSIWARSQSAVGDQRILALLESCQALMGVGGRIEIVVAPFLSTPALFGLRKPRLLMPAGILQKLEARELRMVFLHELAHVRGADIPLNWIIIFVRSLHWFNPLVWLALRRLRADRELVCDAMVMSRLGVEERQVYGDTLIKLLDDFSGAGFCPSLAPVINNRTEIKRRVIMIAQFKPAGHLALAVSAMLMVALCCFTFTRAAEKQPVVGGPGLAAPQTTAKADSGQRSEADSSSGQSMERMRRRFEALTARVHEVEARVDAMRQSLGISDAASESDHSMSSLDPQTVRLLEEQRIRAEAQYSEQAGLLNGLRRLGQESGVDELRKSILTVVNDEVLSKLMMDLSATEATLAMLKQTMGPENLDFKSKAAMRADLDDKINQRINGILSGLRVRVDAFHANLDNLSKAVEDSRRKFDASSGKYRAYLEAKRDLENLQKVRDALNLKMLEQEYGVEVPKQKPEAH